MVSSRCSVVSGKRARTTLLAQIREFARWKTFGCVHRREDIVERFRDVLVEMPESGVKIESSDLNRFQSMNLAQDAIGQIL